MISVDWQTAGDKLITVDNNGLQWLDRTLTAGRSFNDVNSELGIGGEFSGFRYATADEVLGLWESAGWVPGSPASNTTVNNGVFDVLAPFVGDLFCVLNGCTPGDGLSHIMHEQHPTLDSRWVARMDDLHFLPERATGDFFHIFFGEAAFDFEVNQQVGHGLVRIQNVPEPSGIVLLFAGLLGIFFRARAVSSKHGTQIP